MGGVYPSEVERFPFKPADDAQTAPQPHIQIAITFRGHSAPVSALYDSGSDITHLSGHWKNYFKVDDALVPKLPVTGLDNNVVVGALVFVTARLDNHEFVMPVAFHPNDTIDLFGRPGINEQFLLEVDSLKGETRVTWQQEIETGADRMKRDVLAVPGNFGNGWDVEP
jgi:hypothetical protein